MRADEPLVTVVTPVFNGEKYLAQCIDSVLAQTWENWEYLIANNLSTDGSLDIARRYAAEEPRIRVYDNPRHLPVIENWNHALSQIGAEGKYCKIVHADDILMPECLSRMVAVAERYPSVGVVGAYRIDENHVNLDQLPYPTDFIPGREFCWRRLTGGPDMFGSPSSTMIRADLIRRKDKFYNEANIHADTELCFDVLKDSDFGFVQQVLTYTRRHNESVTSYINTIHTRKVQQLVRLLKYGEDYLSEEEVGAQRDRMERAYYAFLGREWISGFFPGSRRGKRREFWAFHRNALSDVGYRISSLRVARYSVLAVYRKLLELMDPGR